MMEHCGKKMEHWQGHRLNGEAFDKFVCLDCGLVCESSYLNEDELRELRTEIGWINYPKGEW